MRDFKKATVYEIYIKSFKDSDGDGIGDLGGILEKLPYLHALGVDYIWITPFYRSPLNDNGYDVADYRSIDERFGDFSVLDEVIRKAEEYGIGIMLDMVFNHSSTEHEWFRKALSGDERFKDYYIFMEGDKEPTNWVSKFGGNAWEKVEGKDEYYLHLFHRTQADLNWKNPVLRDEIYDIINFWRQKGVKGFRFDVINLISKPDIFEDSRIDDGRHFYTDGPRIHEYLKEMNERTYGQDPSLVTVGEMSSTSIENSIRYSKPEEKELSMVFSFHHLKVDYDNGNKWSTMPFDFLKLKEILSQWQVGMAKGGGWNATFLSNHDQPRHISRFGSDGEYHKESGKMLACAYFLLRGTPYIYQGEEIGMTNHYFDSIDLYEDVESTNYHSILKEEGLEEERIMEILKSKSRDNARTPMQWDSGKNAGFSTGEPWIALSQGKMVTVEENMKEEDSIFNWYRKLIELRHKEEILQEGDYTELVVGHERIYAYRRSLNGRSFYIILNFYGEHVGEDDWGIRELKDIMDGDVIMCNYPDSDTSGLRPYEALVIRGR